MYCPLFIHKHLYVCWALCHLMGTQCWIKPCFEEFPIWLVRHAPIKKLIPIKKSWEMAVKLGDGREKGQVVWRHCSEQLMCEMLQCRLLKVPLSSILSAFPLPSTWLSLHPASLSFLPQMLLVSYAFLICCKGICLPWWEWTMEGLRRKALANRRSEREHFATQSAARNWQPQLARAY
jgi:hypothetical protein